MLIFYSIYSLYINMGQNISTDTNFNRNHNNNNNSNNNSNNKKSSLNKNDLPIIKKKKYELYKYLQLFQYYINITILDKSFMLKNDLIIKEIEKENDKLEKKIKNNDENYYKNMRQIKQNIVNLESKKYTNTVLFIINILLLLIVIGLGGYIYKTKYLN